MIMIMINIFIKTRHDKQRRVATSPECTDLRDVLFESYAKKVSLEPRLKNRNGGRSD